MDKVTEACHRIESLYYETEGRCYASFSGGKDSTVVLALIKMCEEVLTIPKGGIPAVFSNTGIEMGCTVDFDHEPGRYKASMHWLKDVFIAQNVEVPFDRQYEKERDQIWRDEYWDMRVEMLKKYRPESRLLKKKRPWRGYFTK